MIPSLKKAACRASGHFIPLKTQQKGFESEARKSRFILVAKLEFEVSESYQLPMIASLRNAACCAFGHFIPPETQQKGFENEARKGEWLSCYLRGDCFARVTNFPLCPGC
ncbi:hypothetical protein CEXT_577581 [Caerostris extrusa]|uniref:Uncharacterized protein n=1 Tax=Caerostris extrusa TaxID=172846 RepID=A0AAV4Q5V3_CAEEX|nr:hypothetical protein CEXT_577581 [Caerostris extrusa]